MKARKKAHEEVLSGKNMNREKRRQFHKSDDDDDDDFDWEKFDDWDNDFPEFKH